MADKQRKSCPRCGEKFDCCGVSDCWCEQVQVPSKAMKFVMINFNDCLCPACLKQISEVEK